MGAWEFVEDAEKMVLALFAMVVRAWEFVKEVAAAPGKMVQALSAMVVRAWEFVERLAAEPKKMLAALLSMAERAWEFVEELAEKRVLPLLTRENLMKLLPFTVLLLTLLLLYYCGCSMMKALYRCCRRCFRAGGRMMKAPGRNGAMMRRATFECNPKGYFRDLRAQNLRCSNV